MSVALADPAVACKVNAQTAYSRAHHINLAVARNDPSFFNQMVLRDEAGRPVQQAPFHNQWHDILNDHDRVVLWASIESGKTTQISVGRVLYELGKNPNLRVAVVSNTNEQAKKIVRLIAQYIEKSAELHAIFPDLKPARDQSLPWTANAITVERTILAKDPSVQACGVHGNILGARIDLLILDDILDYENVDRDSGRRDLWQWIQSTLVGRLTANARVWAPGNAWHPEDALHRLAANKRYKSFRFPIVDEVSGDLLWPGQWPKDRIEEKRIELGPLEFARQLLCMSRDEEDARFKKEWIERGIELGRDYDLIRELESGITDRDELGNAIEALSRLHEGFAIFHGVDLASRKTEAADLTCIFTVLLWPDGLRQVLNIETAKMAGPEIVDAIENVYDRFGGIFIVENNAAQQYILQFAEKLTMATCRPFTTGRNKAHPEWGVQGVAAEIASGKWIIPNEGGSLVKGGLRVHKEIDAWIREMLTYNPKDHTGDRLMASWFAREGCRVFDNQRRQSGGVGMRVVG